MRTYDIDSQFYSESEAVDFLKGFVFSDCETTEHDYLRDYSEVESYQGVSLLYNRIADHYIFEDIEGVTE